MYCTKLTFTQPQGLKPRKKVTIALYYRNENESQNITASCVVYEICSAITKYMGPKNLYLPIDKEPMSEKVSPFEAKYGILQTSGAIDGTHKPISSPKVNSQDSICYKQYCLIDVQGVCDYKCLFMDVECSWPGSTHDIKIYAQSSINIKMRNGELPTVLQALSENTGKIPNYLIGDPAYILTPY